MTLFASFFFFAKNFEAADKLNPALTSSWSSFFKCNSLILLDFFSVFPFTMTVSSPKTSLF